MNPRRIRVTVGPGTFPSERTVSFVAGGRKYSLLVDAEDLQGDTLSVSVVAESPDRSEALIDLPRDTFTSGSRIRVPIRELLPA